MNMCKYRHIFGTVNEGIHAYRLFDVAIVDVIFTVLGAYFIHLLFPTFNFINLTIVLFIIGILMHRLFCVRTTIDKLLFST